MSLRIGMRLIRALSGFAYHYYRYCRYAGWRERYACQHERNYKAVKIYHALEKSLSFSNRREGAGIANASSLAFLIDSIRPDMSIGFHDRVAPDVLRAFIKASPGVINVAPPPEKASDLRGAGGVLRRSKIELDGSLEDPERFFFSRFSLREFDGSLPDASVIERAVRIATKSPSACNRQPWHVYKISSPELIREVLRHQNGNRGFGDRVPMLLIMTCDLRAFGPGAEHYQHWIDGGMFSMSLIYALHSLGLASCCLNWSATPEQDMALRRTVPIRASHSIVMMLAVGVPREVNTVCCSPRRPLDEVFSDISKASPVNGSHSK